MYEYKAHPVYVVDGDTVDLDVDLGFHVTIRDRFRLRGINTPERGQPGYQEAKYFVSVAILSLPFVAISTYLDRTDKYGRMLAELYYTPDVFDPAQRHLNAELVERGLAVPYMTGA